MLERVEVGERTLSAYRGVAPDSILDELIRRAASLRGARVLHLNATPYGGGVSELLRSSVPLLNALGLIADWRIASGDDAFFKVTKAIHNGLQGRRDKLDAIQRSVYLASNERNAALLQEEYDFVFVHDPQPAALLPLHGKGKARWIWRCHIDTAHPDPEVWQFLRGYLAGYDAAIFTMSAFVPPDLPIARVEIIPPAIDPLSPKNMPLADQTAREILEWIGVPVGHPLVTQVSRFDPWKDPLGVIAAYRLAREEIPNLRLALVGAMALDDPEGWDVYRSILAARSADPGISLFTNLTGVGNIEVNAFQRLSGVIVQKSVREGFGLVVSEALWKGTAVVAGRTGGIPLQMADGAGGILVDDVEGCAAALVALLRDPARRAELGRKGQARVRSHFLLPRLLLDEIALMERLTSARPLAHREAMDLGRDPVCGMAVRPETAAAEVQQRGRAFRFCSRECRARFLAAPERYRA